MKAEEKRQRREEEERAQREEQKDGFFQSLGPAGKVGGAKSGGAESSSGDGGGGGIGDTQHRKGGASGTGARVKLSGSTPPGSALTQQGRSGTQSDAIKLSTAIATVRPTQVVKRVVRRIAEDGTETVVVQFLVTARDVSRVKYAMEQSRDVRMKARMKGLGVGDGLVEEEDEPQKTAPTVELKLRLSKKVHLGDLE